MADGIQYQAYPGLDLEFIEEGIAVIIHRAGTYKHFGGYVFIGKFRTHPLEKFFFLFRQLIPVHRAGQYLYAAR